jgi:hypothetical protein
MRLFIRSPSMWSSSSGIGPPSHTSSSHPLQRASSTPSSIRRCRSFEVGTSLSLVRSSSSGRRGRPPVRRPRAHACPGRPATSTPISVSRRRSSSRPRRDLGSRPTRRRICAIDLADSAAARSSSSGHRWVALEAPSRRAGRGSQCSVDSSRRWMCVRIEAHEPPPTRRPRWSKTCLRFRDEATASARSTSLHERRPPPAAASRCRVSRPSSSARRTSRGRLDPPSARPSARRTSDQLRASAMAWRSCSSVQVRRDTGGSLVPRPIPPAGHAAAPGREATVAPGCDTPLAGTNSSGARRRRRSGPRGARRGRTAGSRLPLSFRPGPCGCAATISRRVDSSRSHERASARTIPPTATVGHPR